MLLVSPGTVYLRTAHLSPLASTIYDEMNWVILGYGAVILFSLAYYLVRARFKYVGPVEYVRKGI